MSVGLIMSEIPNSERVKKAVVEWTKPRLLDKQNPLDVAWYDGQLSNTGIYYISRKFGANETLLYIGQTSDSYFTRIQAHQENWLYQVRGRIFIRLGYIVKPSKKSDLEMKQIIKDIEGALIFEMKPPYNVDGKNSYTPKHLYAITNDRYRGALPESFSMRSHILEKQ